jgi:hypothetical protein
MGAALYSWQGEADRGIGGNFMSLSVLSPTSTPVAAAPAEVSKPAASSAPAAALAVSLPHDTVSLSPAALKASGDVDHDGDSH